MTRVKTEYVDFRVEVVPRYPSWRKITAEQAKVICKDLEAYIRRHCDDVQQVNLLYDIERSCVSCGGRWTEDSDTYNGGCCDEDEKNNPSGDTR